MSEHAVRRVHPGPSQESVWDYPRPPRVEPTFERVVVELGGVALVDTTQAVRVLETSHPPVYCLLRSDFPDAALRPAEGTSYCEFKGSARYLDVVVGNARSPRAAWFYPDPAPAFESLRDRVAVYPAAMDRCRVDEEIVQAQDGGFYGGWITSRVVGPFKGSPGTRGW